MKSNFRRLWLLLSAYGICFAILSSIEEIMQGKLWKALSTLALSIVIYFTIVRDK